MPEIKPQLIQDIQGLENDLLILKTNWANHIVNVHGGWPATSCHGCINFRHNIELANYLLNEYRNKLNGLDDLI